MIPPELKKVLLDTLGEDGAESFMTSVVQFETQAFTSGRDYALDILQVLRNNPEAMAQLNHLSVVDILDSLGTVIRDAPIPDFGEMPL